MFSILNTKLFHDVPLPDLPVTVSTHRTRQTVDMSNSVSFLLDQLLTYSNYITELSRNFIARFEDDTLKICVSIGKLINFDNLVKHNPLEPSDDLTDTGTIDKLTFVRLCDPPPGMKQNRKLFECALNHHFT